MHIVLSHDLGAKVTVMIQTLTVPAYVCLQRHGTNTIHISNNSYASSRNDEPDRYQYPLRASPI